MGKSRRKKSKVINASNVSPKEKAKQSAPRNEIVRAMVEQKMFQSKTHKNKKEQMKKGYIKHKTRNCGF